MSVGLAIESSDLKRLQTRLLQLSRVRFTELLDVVGATVESQTRRRIQKEKTDPSGKEWKEWSEKYAASKHGPDKNHAPHPGELRESQGHTILSLSGSLLDSLQSSTILDEVEIGSNLVYARRQNKDRAFIGLSQDNTTEVLKVIDDFLDEHLRLT